MDTPLNEGVAIPDDCKWTCKPSNSGKGRAAMSRSGRGVQIGHGEQEWFDFVERFGTDAAYATKVVPVAERAVGFAVGDDPLGENLAHTRKQREFGPVGLVDVDLALGHVNGRAIKIDPPRLQLALPQPVPADQEPGAEQDHDGDRLLGAPQEA